MECCVVGASSAMHVRYVYAGLRGAEESNNQKERNLKDKKTIEFAFGAKSHTQIIRNFLPLFSEFLLPSY